MSWCHNGIYTQYIHTKYLPYMYLLKTGAPGGSMSQVIPFSIFESMNICLKHFVKVSAVDKGRFRFTISWHIIVSDFITAFRRSILLLVMFGLFRKVFLLGQCGFWFQHGDEHHFCLREHMQCQWHRRCSERTFPLSLMHK